MKKNPDGEYSDTVEKGCIISQEPAAGEPVVDPDNMFLYVVVSKGPAMTTLPNVKDKSYTAAAEELTNLGLVALMDVEYSDTVAEGKAIDYVDRRAGDQVDSGSEVTLKVSRGAKKQTSSNTSQ